MTDRAKLEEALKASGAVVPYHPLDNKYIIGGGALAVLREAAEAHLASLPKVKMVEVWRVEWARQGSRNRWIANAGHFDSENDARDFVNVCASAGHACLKVTGPHLQEVPQ